MGEISVAVLQVLIAAIHPEHVAARIIKRHSLNAVNRDGSLPNVLASPLITSLSALGKASN